ncbi:MAG: hypothetical protein WCI76_02240 [bacterium]
MAQIPKSHGIRSLLVVIVILLLIGGAVWFFLQKKSSPSVQNEPVVTNNVQAPKVVNLDDLKISYVVVPADQNSASIFNAIPSNIIAKEDIDLMTKYFNNYPPISYISLAESKKILTKYPSVLASFELGAGKQYYQCSVPMGDNCYLNVLRYIPNLAALNSFVLFKEGKVADAQDYAQKIIKLGQMVTAQTDDVINLLVGWIIQRTGYYALHETKPISGLSIDDKNTLLKNLREEQKKVFQFMYTRQIESVDYITDINKKPSGVIDKDTEDTFNEYRKAANNTTWKPDIVKKWFNDSLKIELSNIDLPCSSVYKDSKIDTGFNPKDTSQTDNFVGKTLYSITYGSFNTLSTKRCEVEGMINNL